jgi:SAM-dependent methyltransferase
MIDVDVLRSPCCRVRLDTRDVETLACHTCGALFPIRTFGPDLMPLDAERRYEAYPQWQAVQAALTAWRTRTWTGDADAQAQTQRNAELAATFVAWAGIACAVLDVGCGSGWIRSVLPAADYHGIDPMPAEQDYLFPFVRGIGDRLPFPDGTFDACCFFSSLDYALSVETTLAEAHRVLKPGGVIAIATPIHTTKEIDGEPLHHYRFLAGELEGLVAQAFSGDVTTLVYRPNYHFLRARTRGHELPARRSAPSL